MSVKIGGGASRTPPCGTWKSSLPSLSELSKGREKPRHLRFSPYGCCLPPADYTGPHRPICQPRQGTAYPSSARRDSARRLHG